MRVYANNTKSTKLFRAGKTFWRCLVKHYGGRITCWISQEHLNGRRVTVQLGRGTWKYTSLAVETKVNAGRYGKFKNDLFGHSDSVITFTTPKEAIRFKEAVENGDTSHPFVKEALNAARGEPLRDLRLYP